MSNVAKSKLKNVDPKGPVRLNTEQAWRVWIHEHTRMGEHVIPSLPHTMPGTVGVERLLFSGAKLYRDRNGFKVMGYAFDGSDVMRVLEAAGLV